MSFASRSLASCSNHNSGSNQSQPSLATFCLLLIKVTFYQKDGTFSGDHPSVLSDNVDAASSQHLPLNIPIDFLSCIPTPSLTLCSVEKAALPLSRKKTLSVWLSYPEKAPENTEFIWSAVRELTKLGKGSY